jgi:hypothetical protein
MRKYNRPVTLGNDFGNAASSRLIPASEWHPLDGVPAPEYIPEEWIGPHVGLRMVEAFKTLAKLPLVGISNRSGLWPDYRHEWEDLLAQQTSDAEVREQDAREQNRARLAPSAEDISRMERVIGWPARYLQSEPDIARIVQRVAFYRATQDLALDAIARRLRQNFAAVRRDNRNGLDTIAAGLRRDGEAVF